MFELSNVLKHSNVLLQNKELQRIFVASLQKLSDAAILQLHCSRAKKLISVALALVRPKKKKEKHGYPTVKG